MSIPMHEYRGVPQDAPPPMIVRTKRKAKHAHQHDEATGWMSIPIGIPNCPQGLEYLTALNEIFIQREQPEPVHVQATSAPTNTTTPGTTVAANTPNAPTLLNKYCIKNGQGQQAYFGFELGNRWKHRIWRSKRPFQMQIVDNFQNVVLHLTRPLRCNNCLFPGCLQEMTISTTPDTIIGRVHQAWSPVRSKYILKNPHGETMLTILGPLPTLILCMRNVQFRILTVNGNEIGIISRDCAGPSKGLSADTDYFGVTFPMDIDARMKAVIVGATFLIGLLHFNK